MKMDVRLSAAVVCFVLSWGVSTPSSYQATTEAARDRWNKEFAGPLPNLNRSANALMVSVVKGKAPGRALDLGVGEGRNAIYLARNGWSVTGVDLSEVAVAEARKNAAANKTELALHVADLDAFDFGKGQWDLIVATYMHGWQDRSKTDVPGRIYDALKPGGLLVMEAYAKPEVAFGYSVDELSRAYGRFQVLKNESVNEAADWDKDNKRHLVRFVAQKPGGSPQDWFDLSVRPQDDFFRYANGGWLARTEIPADRARHGVWDELSDRVRNDLNALLAGPQSDESAELQKARAFYASFMNESQVEALKVKPLIAELAAIDKMQTAADLARVFARLSMLDVAVPLTVGSAVDLKNPKVYVATLAQGGLALPNREYYVGDSGFARYREHYGAYLNRIFDVLGANQAGQQAREVIALETRLAEQHWTAVASRDRVKTYNKFTFADLKVKMPGFEWDTWAGELGLPANSEFVVAQPSFVETFAKLAAAQPIHGWKPYLKAALISRYAPFMSSDLAVPHFELFSKSLEGAPAMRPRSDRAAMATSTLLPFVVGRIYVDRHFAGVAKTRMEALVENLRGALRESIATSEWMSSPETRKSALEKLALFQPNIGYPSKWLDYSAVVVTPDDLVGNVMRALAFQRADALQKIRRAVDRGEWLPRMPPQVVNASYNAGKNTITFPAAILQPPYFDVNGDDAANYGAIGAVIGHEMGHGFDDQGRRSDGHGLLRDWWTNADAEAYQQRAALLVAQYDAYEVVPGFKVNGKLTLGENIGDLTGVAIALRAYQRSLGGKPAPILDGKTGEQRFFIAWARVWREKQRDDMSKKQVATDPHAPSAFRANGPLGHIPEFYEAFNVKPGDGMYIEPQRRVKIF